MLQMKYNRKHALRQQFPPPGASASGFIFVPQRILAAICGRTNRGRARQLRQVVFWGLILVVALRGFSPLADSYYTGDKQTHSEMMTMIPKILIFTHGTNLLTAQAKKEDLKLFGNIVNTIQLYADVWKPAPVQVWFLDDAECRTTLQLVEPWLVPFFDQEHHGAYKGDMCRAAALYLRGGYYFDADMKTILPPVMKPHTTLAAVQSDGGGFFNSFMVSSPGHEVISLSIQLMLHYYQYNQHKQSTQEESQQHHAPVFAAANISTVDDFMSHEERHKGMLGPLSLEYAYRHFLNQGQVEQMKQQRPSANNEDVSNAQANKHALRLDPVNGVEFFLESGPMNLGSDERRQFPNVTFQDEGTGHGCNHFVYRMEPNPVVYFFSRFVGGTWRCDYPDGLSSYPPGMKGQPPLPWEARQARLQEPRLTHVDFSFHLPATAANTTENQLS